MVHRNRGQRRLYLSKSDTVRAMSESDWTKNTLHELHGLGFNVVGVTDGTPYQQYLAGCRSAVVFANGGTLFWECFLEDIRKSPKHLSNHEHPIDDFVSRCIKSVDPTRPASRRWIQCSETAEVFLDFRVLGRESGLGYESPLGLLIHPVYGLWVSMRMVLLTTESIDSIDIIDSIATIEQADLPSASYNPCTGCVEKPCIASCPAGAVTTDGWSVQTCASFHETSEQCIGKCHSRLACPVGQDHRHSTLQQLYHNARTLGRKRLGTFLSIKDRRTGKDPSWTDWTTSK